MTFARERYHRRSIRLQGYDYSSPGAYFVTICTHDRVCLFGNVIEGTARLNAAGQMAQSVWDALPIHYPGTDLDAFIVMPNHIHAIIVLVGAGPRACPQCDPVLGQPQGVAPTMSLANVVHRFKTMTTKRYVDGVKQSGWPVFRGRLWQRNYYEHIIRNDDSLSRIRQYIADNPTRWEFDRENPNATQPEPEEI